MSTTKGKLSIRCLTASLFFSSELATGLREGSQPFYSGSGVSSPVGPVKHVGYKMSAGLLLRTCRDQPPFICSWCFSHFSIAALLAFISAMCCGSTASPSLLTNVKMALPSSRVEREEA